MKKKNSRFLLIVIICCYSLFYIATSVPDKDCVPCNQIYALETELRDGRPYVLAVNSCNRQSTLDTLCIIVSDTTGINWNALADTACITSSLQNLPVKAFYVLKVGTVPRDTLARVTCP
jgi:hypothetical protein